MPGTRPGMTRGGGRARIKGRIPVKALRMTFSVAKAPVTPMKSRAPFGARLRCYRVSASAQRGGVVPGGGGATDA
ncbi:hypothetical protein D4Q52_24185 [Rhodopseudomonas palustris]|uniref:Uncharacterized protein n=1 Tax=Rhodopseudomonas palustris TaxID=1076 RepID=A0A418UXV2_RHOPL|nr:hypothetical protein D4Q52_24185 [Rhodopseudomonas palustris]